MEFILFPVFLNTSDSKSIEAKTKNVPISQKLHSNKCLWRSSVLCLEKKTKPDCNQFQCHVATHIVLSICLCHSINSNNTARAVQCLIVSLFLFHCLSNFWNNIKWIKMNHETVVDVLYFFVFPIIFVMFTNTLKHTARNLCVLFKFYFQHTFLFNLYVSVSFALFRLYYRCIHNDLFFYAEKKERKYFDYSASFHQLQTHCHKHTVVITNRWPLCQYH